jgi:hypothetical protein
MLRIERGEELGPRGPNVHHLVNLAIALAVPLKALLEDDWLRWTATDKHRQAPKPRADWNETWPLIHGLDVPVAPTRPVEPDRLPATPRHRDSLDEFADWLRTRGLQEADREDDPARAVVGYAAQRGFELVPHQFVLRRSGEPRAGWAVFRTDGGPRDEAIGFLVRGHREVRLLRLDTHERPGS